MEMPGIEPGASHMRSVRSTTELHPQQSLPREFFGIDSNTPVVGSQFFCSPKGGIADNRARKHHVPLISGYGLDIE